MDEITIMGIGIVKDKIVINLGTCTGNMSMSRDNAIRFAELIKQYAESLPVEIITEEVVGRD